MTGPSLFETARKFLPGGVNSPVRAWNRVGGEPLFFIRGQGNRVFDHNQNAYIDYVGAWGPAILGHSHPAVIDAITEQLRNGIAFGAPHPAETELAALLCQQIPSLQQVRMVNSGTEAAMSAIRLARAATGRDALIKFSGGYHGHADSFLTEAGSGALDCGSPSSPGVPEALAKLSYCAEYNDPDSVEAILRAHSQSIAAIIVEPIAGNMNCVPPEDGFLPRLRKLCDEYGCLLIFDEVMCGFRVTPGTAQQRFEVIPDLTLLGKIIGGGLPVGAFGGRRELMQLLAPEGTVYQAGTLSGNPLAMRAGLATLNAIAADPDFFEQLEAHTTSLAEGLQSLARHWDIPFSVNTAGGMFGIFFSDCTHVSRYEQVLDCDRQRFADFFHGLLRHGISLAPSPFESCFVSAAHDKQSMELTLEAANRVFESMAAGR